MYPKLSELWCELSPELHAPVPVSRAYYPFAYAGTGDSYSHQVQVFGCRPEVFFFLVWFSAIVIMVTVC